MPRTRPRSATRQRVLEISAAHFRAYGYEGTTMVGIARELDISAQALYWHFRSKEELLLAFLKTTLQTTVEVLGEAAGQGETVAERLGNVVRAHVHIELGESARAMMRVYGIGVLAIKLPSETEQELREMNRVSLDIYRDLLRTGMANGEFRQLDVNFTALAISAMINGAGTWHRDDRDTVARVADKHAELALAIVSARS